MTLQLKKLWLVYWLSSVCLFFIVHAFYSHLNKIRYYLYYFNIKGNKSNFLFFPKSFFSLIDLNYSGY